MNDRIADNRRRAEELAANPIPMPEGEFDVILADPPWDLQLGDGVNNNPARHYAVMSSADIASLRPPIATDAACFIWATGKQFPDALEIMRAWGFEYKTFAVWVKPYISTGYWLRMRHEPLLLGIRGTMPIDIRSERDSVIFADKKGHSVKPVQVYKLIESMFPNRRCLELFSRQSPQGWTTWGTGEKVDKRDYQLEFQL